MSDPFIGEIRAFPYTFVPLGWLACDGSTLSVAQNQELYAVIGNAYGGTPNQTFQLPNLMGSVGQAGLPMLGQGQGTGLSAYPLAAKTGASTVTVAASELPSHSHTITAINSATLYSVPTDVSHLSRYLASPGIDNTYTDQPLTANSFLDPSALSLSGSSSTQPHDNMQPYLTFRFCIAVEGMFPMRP